jgi:hypothetical protein
MTSSSTEIKLINEGTFGCIFYPGLTCNGTPLKGNFVTKIQKDADTVKNEIEISQKVRNQIKGYMKHFSPIVSQCNVKINKSNVDEVKQCEVFGNMTNREIEQSKYVANKIRYVGKTNLANYLTKRINSQPHWRDMYRTYRYLLKSIQKLVDINIVHFDIKYNNILFDSVLHVPILIDFGLSFSIADVVKAPHQNRRVFYTYNTYTYWCIEIFLCNYLFQVITYERAKTMTVTSEEVDTLYRGFIYGTDSTSTHMDNYVFTLSDTEEQQLEFERQYHAFMKPFVNQPWWSVYTQLIQYWKTWDHYSLAVVYLCILDEWKKEHLDRYNAFLLREHESRYVQTLQAIVFSMPDKRPGIEEVDKRIERTSSLRKR